MGQGNQTGVEANGVGADACGEPTGLSQAEAERRLAIHGENRIASGPKISPVRILLRQFRSTLVVILVLASVAAALLGETIDAAAILLIVGLNGVLGFLQEWRAERAIEALRDMLAPTAEVIRDDRPRIIETRLIVPGDLVVLSEGQKVPADIRLSAASALRIDESALTGESVPVDRSPGGEEGRLSMGTLVVSGRGEGVVEATGGATRFGQVAALTDTGGEKTTQLQRQMSRLGRRLGALGLVLAGAIFLFGLAGGRDLLEMLLTSVSVAVAVVPEGLPLVVTLTLAIGASAMARRQVLLRRLQAINTLGAASVICTDKTGTLTENRMTAVEIRAAGRRYEVTGTGYDPAGRILRDGHPVRAEHDATLQRLLHAGLVCNNARLEPGRNWRMHGDPTEGALVTLAYKGWTPLPDPGARMAETPFTSERKRMGMLARRPDGTTALFVKGAPEAVLAASARVLGADGVAPLDTDMRARLLADAEEMSAEGLRVIAIADRDATGPRDTDEERLVFLGFAGLLDPPREEVEGAVALCHAAGIRVVMITGDSPATARAIAGRVGIRHEAEITGAVLDAMSDEALARALERDALFARTTPVHKLRIVDALQKAGGIVAMTGDGVNDAPALRRADIGMAMGERGTDVAKEASDLVILDDNFATIVHAIEEGRRQFANIRKFVRYLLSSNSAEVIALAINLAIGGPLVLLPVHLLWINLLTDGVSAVALGLEPAEAQQMQRPPLDRDERVLTADGITVLAAFGIYMGAVCAGVFYLYLPEGEALARTVAFTTLVACQEVAVFAFRSDRRPAVALGFLSNRWLLVAVAGMLLLQGLAIYWPPLQALMGTVPLGPAELGVVLLAALPVILVPTAFKLIRRRRDYSLT